MRHNHTARRVAFGLLLTGIAIPVAAQDAQPVTPPPVTTDAAPAPAASATPEPAPAPAQSPTIQFAPQAPVVQNVPPPPAPPPEAAATPAPERAVRTTTRQTTSRTAVAQRTTRPAAAASAPAAAPSPRAVPEPVASMSPAPETAAVPPADQPEATPAPAPAPAQPTTSNDWLMWAPIIVGGLVILGLLAFIMTRRRRSDAIVYEQEPYALVEDAPAAAAPVAATSAESRPWIDLGLRPIRADGALEVELTLSNTGDADAHDVRVSTWMLNGAETSANERGLIEDRSGAQIATIDVAPGDDQRIDTTLALPDEATTPILVAEARYPLPDGSEGRIAATFEIEVSGQSENVEARLHDVLERA